MANLNYLFVFDIETVPDHEVVKNLLEIDEQITVDKARDLLTKYHYDITDGKNIFPRQLFHKVVAISYVIVKIDYFMNDNYQQEEYSLKFCQSAGKATSSEYDLVKSFFDNIDKFKPRMITFNGRTFDIPVLKYRAMKHGIQGRFFHQSAKSKWESYNSKYSLDWHCDLLDALSDFGLSARLKLNEICSILGLPGKFGVSGANVQDMYDNCKIDDIRNYCETDVLNTYLVYLRYMHNICKISTDTYNNSINQVITFLEGSEKSYMLDFLTQWEKACNGEFFL